MVNMIIAFSYRQRAAAGLSAYLFHDQHKVNPVSPEKADGNIRDDGDDLALKVVQELLQLALTGRHPQVEAVHAVLHQSCSYLPA
jgi:hypothetical protein